MKTEEKRKNKKVLIAILLLLLAFAIILGFAIAYFSDIVAGNITATAGTLDIRPTAGSESITRWYTVGNSPETSDAATYTSGTNTYSIANLNPGDIVDMGRTVESAGNKSAYVRTTITLTVGTNHKSTFPGTSMFKFYATGTSHDDIRAGTATEISSTDKIISTVVNTNDTITVSIAPAILDGTGAGAETETGGVSSVPGGFILYFDKAAGNDYQGTALTGAFRTEAVQFRNMPLTAGQPDWSSAVALSTPFTIGQ